MLKNIVYKGLIGATCALALTGLTGCGEMDNHSTYELLVDDISQVTVGEQTNVDVTLKADDIRDLGYDKVLIRVDASDRQHIQLKATDTQDQEWDVAQVGYWGPPDGFAIANDYEVTTTFKVTVTQEGDYSVKLDLVDLENNDAVITTKTIDFSAVNA